MKTVLCVFILLAVALLAYNMGQRSGAALQEGFEMSDGGKIAILVGGGLAATILLGLLASLFGGRPA